MHAARHRYRTQYNHTHCTQYPWLHAPGVVVNVSFMSINLFVRQKRWWIRDNTLCGPFILSAGLLVELISVSFRLDILLRASGFPLGGLICSRAKHKYTHTHVHTCMSPKNTVHKHASTSVQSQTLQIHIMISFSITRTQ